MTDDARRTRYAKAMAVGGGHTWPTENPIVMHVYLKWADLAITVADAERADLIRELVTESKEDDGYVTTHEPTRALSVVVGHAPRTEEDFVNNRTPVDLTRFHCCGCDGRTCCSHDGPCSRLTR